MRRKGLPSSRADKLTRALVLCSLLALTLGSCERDVTAPPRTGPSVPTGPRHSVEGCWPITAQCVDRPLTDDERSRSLGMIGGINAGADPRCSQIQQQLGADHAAGNIRLWTDGPAEYHPNNYYGDRHNGPGVSHVTQNAFQSNTSLQATLIHETAHAWGWSDAEANELEQICQGAET